MSKQLRTVQVATKEAIKFAEKMSREDYKAIKHMSKIDLAEYLQRVWRRGYEVGKEAGLKEAAAKASAAPEAVEAAQDKEG